MIEFSEVKLPLITTYTTKNINIGFMHYLAEALIMYCRNIVSYCCHVQGVATASRNKCLDWHIAKSREEPVTLRITLCLRHMTSWGAAGAALCEGMPQLPCSCLDWLHLYIANLSSVTFFFTSNTVTKAQGVAICIWNHQNFVADSTVEKVLLNHWSVARFAKCRCAQ